MDFLCTCMGMITVDKLSNLQPTSCLACNRQYILVINSTVNKSDFIDSYVLAQIDSVHPTRLVTAPEIPVKK